MAALLTLISVIIFLASCLITLSDGQGALVFTVSLPIISLLLFSAILIARKSKNRFGFRGSLIPIFFSFFLSIFFIFAFIPGLRQIPDSFLGFVGQTFTLVVGKTPASFFKDRASFSNKLNDALQSRRDIQFNNLDVTFAWDRVCIFGPYTNNSQAKSVLKIDWNIEERSQIHDSDSINALVFLFQGSVNQVVDLTRGIADFKNVDTCFSREEAHFKVEIDRNGRKLLSHMH